MADFTRRSRFSRERAASAASSQRRSHFARTKLDSDGGRRHRLFSLLAGAKTSHADTDSRPIAVPLIGTQGAASRYPSTLIVNPIGGPAQTGPVSVVLHRVSHPCPEHLAVLLVHDAPGGGKFLLMSNAGGCRPLQGTDIVFSGSAGCLPDSEPVSPPHGNQVEISASNYGAVPAFPGARAGGAVHCWPCRP